MASGDKAISDSSGQGRSRRLLTSALRSLSRNQLERKERKSIFWDVFFLLLIWLPIILLWTGACVDTMRQNDLSGLVTFGWMLLILILPIVGSLIYFIARPAAADASGLGYEPRPATGVSIAEEIERLGKLTKRGTSTHQEFNRQKAWLLT